MKNCLWCKAPVSESAPLIHIGPRFERLCEPCREKHAASLEKARQKCAALSQAPRPRRSEFQDMAAWRRACVEWLDVKRPSVWIPARKRNRCWCGARVSREKFNQNMCDVHLRGKRENTIGDLIHQRRDLQTAEHYAKAWKMEDFFNDQRAGGELKPPRRHYPGAA